MISNYKYIKLYSLLQRAKIKTYKRTDFEQTNTLDSLTSGIHFDDHLQYTGKNYEDIAANLPENQKQDTLLDKHISMIKITP